MTEAINNSQKPRQETDVEANQQVIDELLGDYKADLEENEYIKLIEKMKVFKEEEDAKARKGQERATVEEIEKVMDDFVQEQEDLKIMKETGIRVRRPPKTAKETLDTLKEADERYEAYKKHLYGNPDAAKKAKSAKRPDEQEYNPL